MVPVTPIGTGGGMQLGLSSLQETFLAHPCIPSVHICMHTHCVDGLQTGPGGCQYCACATKHADTPTTKETSTVPSNISKPPSSTVLSNISKLPSSTMPIISVNVTDIKSHETSTTQGAPTTKKVFNNPCILSMNTCEKDCGGQYVKGPEGCEYCLCQSMINIPTTTAAVINQTELTDSTSLPVDRDAMLKEACDIARTICQTKCPHGFHTKANDCFFCECADGSRQFNIVTKSKGQCLRAGVVQGIRQDTDVIFGVCIEYVWLDGPIHERKHG
ncbi:hypothetical protein CHS0354_008443 [Potamilus streckersoni]|uniref:Uncharacterized protein n=1 Tax=Potamilus streckersoni TaxID=2493646 RepID=A0AAE0RPM9_9BIVA|nr:hypothetical protein CHS0354_008443 [Potamilus streckersoni]